MSSIIDFFSNSKFWYAVLAIPIALIIWYFQKERKVIYYRLVEGDLLNIDNNDYKLYGLSITNNGNVAVEDIDFGIDFKNWRIKNWSSSIAKIFDVATDSKNNLTGNIKSLNPKEELKFSFTVLMDDNSINPEIFIRAKNATVNPKQPVQFSTYVSAVALIFTLLTSIAMLDTYISKTKEIDAKIESNVKEEVKKEVKKETKDPLKEYWANQKKEHELYKKGIPDEYDVIFISFNKVGLTDLFPKLINDIEWVNYKQTSFFLFREYIKNPHRKEKLIKALNILKNMSVSPNEKGTINYFLYKIYSKENIDNKAIKELREFEKNAPLLFDTIMNNDTYFDINKLKEN